MKNINSINHDIFNVGSGTEISIIDLAKKMSNNITYIPKRPGEAINNLSSSEKLQSKTDWKPKTYILEWI